MVLQRVYVEAPLVQDLEVTLTADQNHYVIKVLRLKLGDSIRIFNAKDGEWRAAIVSLKPLTLRISEMLRGRQHGTDALCQPTLYLSPIKNPSISSIVAKATELNVKKIVPFISSRTVVRIIKEEKLNQVATEAAEQSERLNIPQVSKALAFESLLKLFQEHDKEIKFFCDEHEKNTSFIAALAQFRCSDLGAHNYSIIIGPEGGFAPYERESLKALPNVIAVSLSSNILRADTAVFTSLALFDALMNQ
jgi:16S rRNA (uracil1498-N3)-methyltransferase